MKKDTLTPFKNQPVIILVDTQLDQNIGKTARAMLNFGLDDLRLVRPKTRWDTKAAYATAAGSDPVLDKAKVFDTLEEACQDCHHVYATTVRPRDMIKDVLTPRVAAADTAKKIFNHHHRVAFVFGAEKAGLRNEDIALCHQIITAPLNPSFSSLNLAQAVVILAYEWFQEALAYNQKQALETFEVKSVFEKDLPSTHEEVAGLVNQLEASLDKSGYFRHEEMKPTMMLHLKNMFHRLDLCQQEVRTLRGVISSLTNPHGLHSRMTHRRQKKNLPQGSF